MLGFFVVVELYELFVYYGNEDLSLVLLANIFSHFVSFFFFFKWFPLLYKNLKVLLGPICLFLFLFDLALGEGINS